MIFFAQPASGALPAARSRTDRRRYPMLFALCGLLLAGAGDAVDAEFTVTKEYKVKAAFLYNFTKFIEWPAESLPAAGSPIVFGVLCPVAFATELEATVRDRRVKGRGLAVKKLDNVDQAASVQLVFVCTMEDARAPALMQAVATRPVVTVGESEAFARAGGIIRFMLDQDKVRFEINIEPAERAGLRISAQLQKLATGIHQAP
jgi:hypothetical protein